jgi:ABC-2 type transport system ATP-binding protein
MIEVKNLTKVYGNKRGINNLNFTVGKGEVLGFLGVNGAGKTTTMNIMTGYKLPTNGSVIIKGFDIVKNPMEAKRCIGYLPENPPLYPEFSVKSYLNFVFDLKGKKQLIKEKHVNEIMELVSINDVSNRVIKNLSKGYRQRVGLAQALISNPEILVLDEPTVGLDPVQIMEIRSLIKNLGKEKTVILSSHILAEVSQICDRVVIINKGKIIAVDSPENLLKSIKVFDCFQVKIKGPKGDVLKKLRSLNGVFNVEIKNDGGAEYDEFNNYSIESDQLIDVREPLFYMLAENKYVIYELKPLEINLEDVFLQLTKEDNEKKLEGIN